VWADFPSVIAAARETGAKAGPILSQAQFLLALGHRGPRPGVAAARPDRAEQVARQLDRLVGKAQMGALFKVACLCAPDLSPPLFEDAT
jgi:NADH dehydrogenase [ubiquinone] 1 alpha subcomplex assembly factor 7